MCDVFVEPGHTQAHKSAPHVERTSKATPDRWSVGPQGGIDFLVGVDRRTW